MGAEDQQDSRAGLAYALAAYVWWGAMPLYIWYVIKEFGITPVEVLGQRIVTGLIFLVAMVIVLGRVAELQSCLAKPRIRGALLLSTLLVGLNWYVYTWAVGQHRATEASLGYFIQPLLNAVFGAVIFRERFRFGRQLSLGIAFVGVAMLVLAAGEWPWIALTLALTFGLYSAVRKVTPVDGLVGLTIETMFLFPAALGCIYWLWRNDALVFGSHSRIADGWILVSGTVTSIPMIFFGQAARRLRLSTLGFIQFLSPTVQFVLAVTIMGEPFPKEKLPGFVMIWVAVLVFIADSVIALRRGARPAPVEAPVE